MDMLIGKTVKQVIRPDKIVPDYMKIVFVDGAELEIMPSEDGSKGLDVCTIDSVLYHPITVLWKSFKIIFFKTIFRKLYA